MCNYQQHIYILKSLDEEVSKGGQTIKRGPMHDPTNSNFSSNYESLYSKTRL